MVHTTIQADAAQTNASGLSRDPLSNPSVAASAISSEVRTMTDVLNSLRSGMSVKQLRADLEGCPSDAIVCFVCSYGDRGNTQQALPVADVRLLDEEFETIASSGYSQSELSVDEVEADEWFCYNCNLESRSGVCQVCKTCCENQEGVTYKTASESCEPVLPHVVILSM